MSSKNYEAQLTTDAVRKEIEKYQEYYDIVKQDDLTYMLKLKNDWKEIIPLIIYLNNYIDVLINDVISKEEREISEYEGIEGVKGKFNIEPKEEVDKLLKIRIIFEFEGLRWTKDEINFALIDTINSMRDWWDVIRLGKEAMKRQNNVKYLNNFKRCFEKGKSEIENREDLNLTDYLRENRMKNTEDMYFIVSDGIKDSNIKYGISRWRKRRYENVTYLFDKIKIQMDLGGDKLQALDGNKDVVSDNSLEIAPHIIKKIEKLMTFKRFIRFDEKSSLADFKAIESYIFGKYSYKDGHIIVGLTDIKELAIFFKKRYQYLYYATDLQYRDNIKFKVNECSIKFDEMFKALNVEATGSNSHIPAEQTRLMYCNQEFYIYSDKYVTIFNYDGIGQWNEKCINEMLNYELRKNGDIGRDSLLTREITAFEKAGKNQNGQQDNEGSKREDNVDKELPKDFEEVIKNAHLEQRENGIIRVLYYIVKDNPEGNIKERVNEVCKKPNNKIDIGAYKGEDGEEGNEKRDYSNNLKSWVKSLKGKEKNIFDEIALQEDAEAYFKKYKDMTPGEFINKVNFKVIKKIYKELKKASK